MPDRDDVDAGRIQSIREDLGEDRRAFPSVEPDRDLSRVISHKERPDRTRQIDDDGLVQVLADDAADVIFPKYVLIDHASSSLAEFRMRINARRSLCYTVQIDTKRQPPVCVSASKTLTKAVCSPISMLSFRKNISFLFVCFLALSAAAFSQTPAPTPTPSDDIGTSKVFEVRLPVTVTMGKKELVSGMTRGDFAVFEDGVRQEVTYFSDEKTNPPVFVGVLMDTSPSTAGKLKFEKEAARNFIYTVTRLRKDKAAFMTFDHEIKLLQDFTDKLDLLDTAVDKVNKTGSQTALYDAIWEFCDEKMRNVPGRRVLVIITDGDDTYSRAVLADAIDIAQRTETTIFAISTKAGFLGTVPGVEMGMDRDSGDKALNKLCEETGGDVFYTGDMLELERSFTKISKELRSQYIITYKPSDQNLNGRVRKVEVKFTDPKKAKEYKIRTKSSYRAVKDSLR